MASCVAQLTLATVSICRPGKQLEHREEANGAPAMNGHAAPDNVGDGHIAGVAASEDAAAAAEQPQQSAAQTVQGAGHADPSSAPESDASKSAVAAAAKAAEEPPKPKDRNGRELRHSKERDRGERRGSRERDGKRSRDSKDGKSGRGDRAREKDRDRKGDDRRGDGKRSGSREERTADGKADRDRKSDKDRRRSRSRSVKRRRSRSVSPAARRPVAGGGGPFGIDRRVPPGAGHCSIDRFQPLHDSELICGLLLRLNLNVETQPIGCGCRGAVAPASASGVRKMPEHVQASCGVADPAWTWGVGCRRRSAAWAGALAAGAARRTLATLGLHGAAWAPSPWDIQMGQEVTQICLSARNPH